VFDLGTWVSAVAPAIGKIHSTAMTGNRSLNLLVTQMEMRRMMIPMAPVGICMSTVWRSSSAECKQYQQGIG
jgi:hypothetical protein